MKEINPYGQVPVVEHDGHLIRESAINFGESERRAPSVVMTVLSSSLVEYLIDVFGGGNTLWPTDPYKKAQGKLLFDGFGSRVCQHQTNY